MATNDYVYNQRLIIGVTTFVLTLAIISYALRLYARRISEARIWFDDITIGIGLVSFDSALQVESKVNLRLTRLLATKLHPLYLQLCWYVVLVRASSRSSDE